MAIKIEVAKSVKVYILVRKDLFDKYPLGKIMAHIGHNVLSLTYMLGGRQSTTKKFNEWYFEHNQTKIVVWIKDSEELWEFFIKFQKLKVPYTSSIIDVKTNLIFCCAIGPVTQEEAEKLGLTKLKLVK